MRDDFIGDFDPTAHGVDRYQGSLKLTRFRKVVEKLRNSGDFIGLFWDTELPQRQLGVRRVGAERMKSFEALALVMSLARRLAINGDQIVPTGPQGLVDQQVGRVVLGRAPLRIGAPYESPPFCQSNSNR